MYFAFIIMIKSLPRGKIIALIGIFVKKGWGESRKLGNKVRGTPRAIPTYTDSAPFSSTTEVTLASTITHSCTHLCHIV